MKKFLDKNIFHQSWPTIKQLVEEQGHSLIVAKKMVCDLYSIPYAQDGGFQFVPEYVEWSRKHKNKKQQERRWVKF